jgi:cytidine deaminase
VARRAGCRINADCTRDAILAKAPRIFHLTYRSPPRIIELALPVRPVLERDNHLALGLPLMNDRPRNETHEGLAASEIGRRLCAAARAAALQAYAPYSRFAVGAALLDERGAIHIGCNVENASYGLTTCAERNAVAAAVAAGARSIRAVAIFTPTPAPTPPCGACRQVLAEFGDAATEVIMLGESQVARATLGELLPSAFGFQPPAPPPGSGESPTGSSGS